MTSSGDLLPDSFFEVTVDDIRVMLRDLKNERYQPNLVTSSVIELDMIM